MTSYRDNEIQEQISQCLVLLKDVFGHDLLGVYLYGSFIVGGLQKFSDIDIFVVADRPTAYEERVKLVADLLKISGVYAKSSKPPIEMTIVVKSEINPWRYPPRFDFQYGDWLRGKFESNIVEPWPTKIMPDLALLITQILLANKTLFGPSPNQLLCPIPYRDFVVATVDVLNNLMADLRDDTRNVLLTYARIWSTLETDTIRSKPSAALWAMERLPKEYKAVLERARSICVGETSEHWNDIEHLIQPCADFMLNQINKQIIFIESTGYVNRSVYFDGAS